MPDALSRLLLLTDAEPTDIDDFFPDDPSSFISNHDVGPRGLTLNNIARAEIRSDDDRHKN